MTLTNPTRQVIINSVDYTSKVKSFWCTDEDLAFGMGKFSVTVADSDGTVAAAFPAWTSEVGLWKTVTITINGVTVFTGLTEKIIFDTGSGGDTVTFEGYNAAADLANQFITKDYSTNTGMLAKDFLRDVFLNAGRTFSQINSFNFNQNGGAYPSATTSPGFLKQRYVLDIVRDVLSATGYAARIDTGNVFQFFDPTNPAYRLTGSVISVYPSTSNNLKEGRTTRDIHETKTYLEFNGAGQGYDPYSNGLTASANGWTPTFSQTASDEPPTIPGTGYQSLLYTVPSPSGGTVQQATFTFNYTNYPIKNDVDLTNGYLNFLFNNKTGFHGWFKCAQSLIGGGPPVMASSQSFNIVFTDTGSNTARLTPDIQLGLDAWTEFTLPVPLQNFVPNLAGQTNPYVYAGAFNFSAISSMVVNFNPGAIERGGGNTLAGSIAKFALNNLYFVCQPRYVPIPLASVDTTYGQRDHVHNVGAEFTQQIDLQNFGDITYPSYTQPQLRNALTVLVDPNVTYYKAGYSIQLNIPRWGYSSAYWRILQVRHEFSNRGYIQKLDLTPLTDQ